MKGEPLEVRLWSRVEKTDTCWLWTGATNGVGYGKMWVAGNLVYTHRLVYELLVGEIPEGLHLDHLCRVKLCVNPAHLEPVTCAENLDRGHVSRGTARRKKPHGTVARYTAGCICADCRAANAAEHLAWYHRTKADR